MVLAAFFEKSAPDMAREDSYGPIVAMLREHLRIPGMGVTNMRNFRDKLTMRELTQAAGIRVPPFAQVKNYDTLREYMAAVPTPYMLKPRMEAGTIGIVPTSAMPAGTPPSEAEIAEIVAAPR